MLSLLLLLLQQQPTPSDMPLDSAARAEVVAAAAKGLEERYVFPEVGAEMAAALRSKLAAKGYEGYTSAVAFAHRLTEDLQALSRDKHLRVRFEEEEILAPPEDAPERAEPTEEEREAWRREAALHNFGFVRVERLAGNLGYIDFRRFVPAEIGREKASQAMAFVAETDALIFDLRQNGGGAPDQIAWICSYLFEGRVHLNDIYFRPEDRTEEFWTDPSVPGAKYLEKDVYVLTSDYTFSGAEEFAYNLRNLGRATLVGETTGGGANPGGMERLSAHFGMFLPTGRAINPITKTNWEGVGVEPHVACDESEALATAKVLALEALLDREPDALAREREAALTAARAELEERTTGR